MCRSITIPKAFDFISSHGSLIITYSLTLTIIPLTHTLSSLSPTLNHPLLTHLSHMSLVPFSQPTMNPSSPTGQPTSRPSSRPTFVIKVVVAASQVILGITANSQQFQDKFIAALTPLLPKYSSVIITSVLLYYDDGTTTGRRHSRALLKSVVGVQVSYTVTTTAAATTPASIVASLSTPNAITSLSNTLAATYPNAFVQAPMIATSGTPPLPPSLLSTPALLW